MRTVCKILGVCCMHEILCTLIVLDSILVWLNYLVFICSLSQTSFILVWYRDKSKRCVVSLKSEPMSPHKIWGFQIFALLVLNSSWHPRPITCIKLVFVWGFPFHFRGDGSPLLMTWRSFICDECVQKRCNYFLHWPIKFRLLGRK